MTFGEGGLLTTRGQRRGIRPDVQYMGEKGKKNTYVDNKDG